MPKSKVRTVYLSRLRRAQTVASPTVGQRHYEAFLQALFPSATLSIKLSENDLTQSVLEHAESLKRVFSARKCPSAVVLEYLDPQADVREYDRMAEAIALSLESKQRVTPMCVILSVMDTSSLSQSVWLKRKLLQACESTATALITVKPGAQEIPTVLVRGNLLSREPARTLPPLGADPQPVHEPIDTPASEMESQVDILYGHFLLRCSTEPLHASHIVSLDRLSKNEAFASKLRRDLESTFHDTAFRVRGLGVTGIGMAALCLQLLRGHRSRLLSPGDSDYHGEAVALICDFLDDAHPIASIVDSLRRGGARRIALVGIAGDALSDPVEVDARLSYLRVSRSVAPPAACSFCAHDVSLSDGWDFDGYARSVTDLDSYSFWRLLAEDTRYVATGHWPSDRTPNHYFFRILTEPLFARYAYSVAIRIRNCLRSKNIPPRWIHKLVCTDGEESAVLSARLAEVLGLSHQDIIKIPRKSFPLITGTQVSTELITSIQQSYGKDCLDHRNVLVVDQAAHHFRTYSALRTVCEHFDSTVLGFAVFIDRTASQVSLGEYLPHAHYLSLYSWPCSARQDFDCVCGILTRQAL